MIDPDYTFDFHSAQVSASDEYHEARRMMGTKGTDLEVLAQRVFHLYMNIHDDGWAEAYLALFKEINQRNDILAGRPLIV